MGTIKIYDNESNEQNSFNVSCSIIDRKIWTFKYLRNERNKKTEAETFIKSTKILAENIFDQPKLQIHIKKKFN